MIVEVQFPEKLRFLAEPHPYKVLYGGRGGMKSWGIARQLLVDAVQRPIRTLCCREAMRTINESVHQLLKDQIEGLNLGAYFEVQKNLIRGVNGSMFAYAGLKHNVQGIKSYEGFDRAWVEEAQVVTKSSWNILIPTIRKKGAEIWVSFNPDLETDATYQMFVVHPPDGAVVVKVGWQDNPWLSEKFMADLDHMRRTDPEEFAHVYEGLCITNVKGAIYANEMLQLDREQRITRIPYDPTQPVQTFWDIGDRYTSIWFAQAFPFEYRIIDYLQDEAVSIDHYLKELQNKPYVYSCHWLPHDARSPQLGTGRSIEEQMRSKGFKVVIVPRLSLVDGINAVRTILPLCWFDGDKCADGVQGLRHYKWAPDTALGVQRRLPLHDWASHPADAFRYLAVALRHEPRGDPKPIHSPYQSRYTGMWS